MAIDTVEKGLIVVNVLRHILNSESDLDRLKNETKKASKGKPCSLYEAALRQLRRKGPWMNHHPRP